MTNAECCCLKTFAFFFQSQLLLMFEFYFCEFFTAKRRRKRTSPGGNLLNHHPFVTIWIIFLFFILPKISCTGTCNSCIGFKAKSLIWLIRWFLQKWHSLTAGRLQSMWNECPHRKILQSGLTTQHLIFSHFLQVNYPIIKIFNFMLIIIFTDTKKRKEN